MQYLHMSELIQSDEFKNSDDEEKVKLLTFYMKTVRRSAYEECEEIAARIAAHPRMGPKTAGAQAVATEIDRIKRYIS